MLTAEQNRQVTQTGPETPAGAVMRRFWQPAALVEELSGERPLRPVRLLSEDLVIFRDNAGRYGLIGRQCPHRGVDLCYGRLEGGGLRCPFHGWLFDLNGNCLEQPGEPEGSTFRDRIHHTAYPCQERNGIIFAYLGPGEAPPLPALDCFEAPEPQTFAFKGLIECNWLQALEVGIDPAHASFLHRFLADEDPDHGYGQQFRDRVDVTDVPMTQILRDYPRPEIRVEETDYGLRIIALRALEGDHMHVRVTNQVFPNAIAIPMSNEMTITQWHVPVDDVTCYWYAIFTSFGAPVDQEMMRAQRLELYELPDYRPRINRSNNYGFDPLEQRSETFTGMGMDINVHDQWAVESPGPVSDRTREHLGATDVAITAYRRLLRRAIKNVSDPNALPVLRCMNGADSVRGPIAIDAVAPIADWEKIWRARDSDRRAKSGWATSLD